MTQEVKLKIPDLIKREGHSPINVIKYPFDFRNVITDMNIGPKLWNQEKKVYDEDYKKDEKIYIDAILHMGITFGDHWQVEKRARRDGYDWVGDDDKLCLSTTVERVRGGKGSRKSSLLHLMWTRLWRR